MTVDEDSFRWLVTQVATLYAAHGEAIGTPLLIEPTSAYFPDTLEASGRGLDALLRRIMSYTPLSDSLNVRVGVVDAEESGGGGCGTGACGTKGDVENVRGGVIEEENGYTVAIHPGDISDPVLLTASLARSVGTLVLLEGDVTPPPDEAAQRSEIAAGALGFGVLLTSASCVYKKGCGGMRMHRGTALSLEENALLLALVARVHGHKMSAITRHLEVTQREAFDSALAWVDSNPELITKLRTLPSSLEDGVFPIAKARGWLGRLFSQRPSADDAMLEAPRAPRRVQRTAEEQQKIDEMRRLVDEALEG